jgi:hypothetical protein
VATTSKAIRSLSFGNKLTPKLSISSFLLVVDDCNCVLAVVELTSVRTLEKVLPAIVLIRVLEEEETGCEDEGEGLEDFEGGSEEEEG